MFYIRAHRVSSLCGGVLGAHCDRSLWSQVDATVNSQYVASLQLATSVCCTQIGNQAQISLPNGYHIALRMFPQ